MKRNQLIRITLPVFLAAALLFSACQKGDETINVAEVTDEQIDAMLKNVDLSTLNLEKTPEYEFPTDAKFLGQWGAFNEDTEDAYVLSIGTNTMNDKAPYTISVSLMSKQQSASWFMTASADPASGNRLIYSDAEKNLMTNLEDISEDYTPPDPEYTGGSGTITLDGENLIWADKQDNSLQELRFARIDKGEEAVETMEAEESTDGDEASSESDTESDMTDTADTSSASVTGQRILEDDEIIDEEDAEWEEFEEEEEEEEDVEEEVDEEYVEEEEEEEE